MQRFSRAASLLAAMLGGCSDTRDLAPASPDTPWQTTVSKPGGQPKTAPPGTPPAALTSGAEPGRFDLPRDKALPYADPHPAIDAGHEYNLVELIDIAQRSNKQTRIVWEQARQAAIAVGISQSAYLPQLTVDVLGGYQRSVTPFPTNLAVTNNSNNGGSSNSILNTLGLGNGSGSGGNNLYNKGYITSQAEGLFPAVTISYLLLDFGGRAANVQAAKQASFAANVSFTAAHQQLMLEVSLAYFQLGAADAQVDSAAQSLKNAQLLLDSADAKLRHGEGTVTEVDQARRSVAQSRYAVAQAASARNASVYSLLSAMGAPPDLKLRVTFPSGQMLPRQVGATVQQLMQTALERRPDLLADLAKLRASQAQIAAARSELFPKVLLSAKGSGKYGRISTEDLPSNSIRGTEAGVYLDFSWSVYQGGTLQNRVRLAQSAAAEAVATLQQAQDQAMRQVALNYDELTTGLTQYDAALALQTASQTAFDSAADAYRHGVGTLTEASNAQTALATARSTVATVHSQVLTTAAALAFATGQLTSTHDVNNLASGTTYFEPRPGPP